MSFFTSALTTPFNLVRGVLNRFFIYVGELSFLVGTAFAYVFRGSIDLSDLLGQMAVIGFNSIPVALLTTFSSGSVIALYIAPEFIKYGASGLTGALVALVVGRELVPVLVGVVVAARSGSAIAAEIGTMKVSEQIDALRSLAVSPVQYLVVPRLLACIVVLPCLCVVADFTALVGGYLVSVWQGVSGASYVDSIRDYVILHDFTSGIFKTVVFGVIIALVSCHQGLITRGGATGVGRATTNAVVLSVVLIYIFDFILAYFMFGGSPSA
jgi:phospholipid/cholesterol/gamma-HCH transport system permease protein